MTTYPIVSNTLNELIQKANTFFEQGKHYVTLAYEQALREGFTPQEAKELLFERITVFSERTIYRYLPDEYKNQYFQQLGSTKNLPRCQGVNDFVVVPREFIQKLIWNDPEIKKSAAKTQRIWLDGDRKKKEVLEELAAIKEKLYTLQGKPINTICQDIVGTLKEAGVPTAHRVSDYLDNKYKR